MVNSLLDVTAIESGKITLDKRPVDIESLTYSIVRYQKLQADKKQIRLDVQHPAAAPVVLADPRRLSEVLDNLVSNAIKYTSPGGQVNIHFEKTDNRWITHIEDTGQGFLSTEIPYVFSGTRKMTSKPTAGEPSIGFGLLAVKKIIDLHEGDIWVHSEREKGSRFSFALTSA